MQVNVGSKWKAESSPRQIGCSTCKSSPQAAFDEREHTPPLNSGECEGSSIICSIEETYVQAVNSSTRPSTTVVDRMFAWFQASHKGRNHGAQARVRPIPHSRGPGDGANLGRMADRSGTPYPATLSPQRRPSSGVGISAGLLEPRRAEKWVADRRSRWGCDTVWHPACAGACPGGCRGGLQS